MADRVDELRAILASVRARWSRRAFLRALDARRVDRRGDADGRPARGLADRAGRHPARPRRRDGRPHRRRRAVVRAAAAAAAAHRSADRALHRRTSRRSRRSGRHRGRQARSPATEPGRRSAGRRCDSRGPRGRCASHRHRRHACRERRSAPRSAASRSCVAFWFFAPSAERAIDVAGSYLFPRYYAIEVTPGSIKVREGQPVTVTARIPGIDGGARADDHGRPRRRGALGAHDARLERRTNSRSR